jgi:hypothetical protein
MRTAISGVPSCDLRESFHKVGILSGRAAASSALIQALRHLVYLLVPRVVAPTRTSGLSSFSWMWGLLLSSGNAVRQSQRDEGLSPSRCSRRRRRLVFHVVPHLLQHGPRSPPASRGHRPRSSVSSMPRTRRAQSRWQSRNTTSDRPISGGYLRGRASGCSPLPAAPPAGPYLLRGGRICLRG